MACLARGKRRHNSRHILLQDRKLCCLQDLFPKELPHLRRLLEQRWWVEGPAQQPCEIFSRHTEVGCYSRTYALNLPDASSAGSLCSQLQGQQCSKAKAVG